MLSSSTKININESRIVMLGERSGRRGETQEEHCIVFSLRESVLEMAIIRFGETSEAMMENPGCIPATNGHITPPVLPPV